MPALVWCASPDGELTNVNQRILDYTGLSLGDLANAGWVNFLHPEDVQQTVAMWGNAVRTGTPHDVQYRLRRHDGAYRWFHVLGQAMADDNGRVVQWYGLLIDIDERKNIQETLRLTETRLAQATQIATVGELAASIAHEINQPLGAVVTNAYACLRWLSGESANLAKAREAAERIVRDGKDTVEVVGRIRALFKRTQVQHEVLDLNAVIIEVVRLIGAEASKRRSAIETELDKDLHAIRGDRVQIQQLVLNLLMNGLDAMDAVTDRLRRIIVRTHRSETSMALVEVEDNGIGMTDAEKAFEPFFTTKEHGMGMGLTICRSIAEGHNGKLWSTQNESFGTTFSFTLPLDHDESTGRHQI
jgi:PAS domain S-box-containing protein